MLYILTLNWDARDKLKRLYNSILPTLENINFKWLIKDNGSKDNSVEEIKSWNNENIIPFAYPNNLQNYSEGNNWLFKKAKELFELKDEDYLLLLNNDIIFNDTTSIKNMINLMENDDQIGVVGCKLNYEDNPELIQHAGVLFHPVSGMPYHYRAGKKEEEVDRKNRIYPIITGAVLLTKVGLFGQVGMFNEKHQWAWEDSALCCAISNLDKKVVYCGQTNILHSESASLKKNPVNKLYFKQNIKLFMDAWGHKVEKGLVKKYEKDQNYLLYKN